MSRPRCLRHAGLVARVPHSRLVPEGHRSLVRLPRGHVRLDVFQVCGVLRSGEQFSRHGGKNRYLRSSGGLRRFRAYQLRGF